MAHGLTSGERVAAYNAGIYLGGNFYQAALPGHPFQRQGAPCNGLLQLHAPLYGPPPALPTKSLVVANSASNWPGIGATKLISPPQQQLPVSPIENNQFSTGDSSLIASAGTNGFFGGVNDLKLGPVEKAVLHQALYNQSKKQTPEMRRCDDCNVIFNSQTQAEMHYKGKKHAKIMYLKRTREGKQLKGRSYSCEAAGVTLPSISANSIMETEDSEMHLENNAQSCSHSDSSTLPNEISLNPHASGVFAPSAPPHIEQRLLSINNDIPITITSNSDPIDTPHVPAETVSSIAQPQSVLIEDSYASIEETIPNKTNMDFTLVEDDGIIKTLPQREPVVLPDPLPRYISRSEKPSVLKESLRCSVCDIYVNSENQMKQHVNSLRHKNIEKGIPTPPKPVKEEKPKGKAEQFRCEVCRVTLNSDIQLLQHLSSQRHKNMLEGKPPKPRWSPYERTQHALLRSAAQIGLSLKAIPNGGSPHLLTAAGVQVGTHPGSRTSLLAPQATGPAHLKQMAYITPNGSILQTREVIYIGAAAPQFSGTHQPQISTSGQILQSPFSIHPELTPAVLNARCVSLDQGSPNYGPQISSIFTQNGFL